MIDPRYFRPAEVDPLLGDAMKAKERLGCLPSTAFELLVELIVDADLELAADEAHLREARTLTRPHAERMRS
jgi:GDP-D-mannose dehydratase